MTNSTDNGNKVVSSSIALKQFAAALVGLVLGQIAGDKSVTVAKLFLFFWSGPTYEQWHVTQVSLIVILVVACAGVAFGAFAAQRGWADHEQVLLSMVAAVIVALFTIIDQSLPNPTDSSQLPTKETLYYVGWVVGLWLVPVFLQPNPNGQLAERIRRGGGLLGVVSVMAVACWLGGTLLVEVARYIVSYDAISELTAGAGANLGDPRKFWLASPSAVNPICSVLFVVSFSPIWWQELWRHRQIGKACIWIASFSAFGLIYAGLFGGVFYAERGWAARLIARDLAESWQFFLTFGAFPAVMIVTVLLSFRLTRRDETSTAVGWPVSDRFWLLLPLGLALGFAAVSLLGLAPLARLDEVSWPQIAVLTTAHAINGILLGLTLRVLGLATRLISRGHGARPSDSPPVAQP